MGDILVPTYIGCPGKNRYSRQHPVNWLYNQLFNTLSIRGVTYLALHLYYCWAKDEISRPIFAINLCYPGTLLIRSAASYCCRTAAGIWVLP